MEKQGRWLLCPSCHSKTRVWIREDTVLENFLLFCPKCKQEQLVEVRNYQIKIISEPDACRKSFTGAFLTSLGKTQSQ